MPMNFDIIPLIFEPKCLGFQKGLLLACKRVRFALQKESFYTAKGLHLEGKRTPFEKAIKKTAKTCVALIYYCIFANGRQLLSKRHNSIINKTEIYYKYE